MTQPTPLSQPTLGILQLTITQNVDGLHHKAGSVRVVEIHGSRYKLRCIDCESRWLRDRFEIPEYPPHCPECDGLVKMRAGRP